MLVLYVLGTFFESKNRVLRHQRMKEKVSHKVDSRKPPPMP